MPTYIERTKIESTSKDGTVISRSTTETTAISKLQEPDYIKVYTNMWCEFMRIPEKWRKLFMCLATRMSFADSRNPQNSQVASIGGPFRDAIIAECGWSSESPFYAGIAALEKLGAIRRIRRGYIQINPMYAGKGYWKYSPKYGQGGIEDLVATFNFRAGTVDTEIVYAATAEDEPELGLEKETTLIAKETKTVTVTPTDAAPGRPARKDTDSRPLPNQVSWSDVI